MKFDKQASLLAIGMALALLAAGCGGSGPGDASDSSSGSSSVAGSSLPPMSGANVMQLTVNGSLCASGSYPNKPCVSVTICSPGTSNCQTISDILLDTGSYGLRLFNQVVSVPLAPVTTGNSTVAECVQFGDGSSDWGPVEEATVILGGEAPVTVPIQVINSNFTGGSTNCAGSDTDPGEAGFNGILGVGLFAQDCGSYCTGTADNGVYFACNGSSCSGMRATTQVVNPVTQLSSDNNGVIVELPGVALGGQASADGYLVLGIGTQSNNAPSGVTPYEAGSESGEMQTQFSGVTYSSFLDSGSNGLFLTAPQGGSLPDCGSQASGWFCPSGTPAFTATNISASGAPRGQVSFNIGNAINLMNSNNNAFVELGGDGPGEFDWGLPFYFGRSVYVGFESATSSLGNGPLWAY